MGQVIANTEVTLCEQICSGSGTTVVQLNMITLGGPNGLNS